MTSSYVDMIAKSGSAFIGQAISDGTGVGNAALWNPWGSGKILLLDKITLASSVSNWPGADLRAIRSLTGFSAFPDHWRNADGTDVPPAGQIYTMSGAAPNDYPFNRPHHEFWMDGQFRDKEYPFAYPLIIPQGRGECASLSHVGACILSMAWREEDDPLGIVNSPGIPHEALGGTTIGNMSGLSVLRDGNETTYATSSGDAESVIVGVDLGSGNSAPISRTVFRSPIGRSFCGANPPRALTISYGVDGSSFTPLPGGSVTDATGSAQCIIDLEGLSLPASQHHYFKLSNPSVAGWRIAEMVLYE